MREHGFFQSLYFREPSGAIIEVATDGPGLPQEPETAGRHLTLPPELESRRAELELVLPNPAAPGESRLPKRDLGWVHRFHPGDGEDTLLLLHGSGSEETSLLPFARGVSADANLLAVRGRSLEEGSPRFFRRSADGFDQEQIIAEADALAAFVADAARLYGFDASRVTLLGYSNGANIGFASLVRNPATYQGAVLLRPVMVMEDPSRADLEGKAVLVVLGEDDPYLPQAEGVVDYLREQRSNLHVERLPTGHGLSEDDSRTVREWLQRSAQHL